MVGALSKQETFPKFPKESELDEANEPHENLKIVERDLQRISEWQEKTKKILQELLENSPKYPDTVGGMYPVEVQIYACDVDEFVEKVKQFLEALK